MVFGVTSSPFLLNATVRRHLELHSDTHGDLVSKVMRSIYVDDIVAGSQTEEEAYSLYTTHCSRESIARSQLILVIHPNPAGQLTPIHKPHWVEAKGFMMASRRFSE